MSSEEGGFDLRGVLRRRPESRHDQRFAARLDEEIEPWRPRPLEGRYPYLILDARCEKARVEHRIGDVAVLVAIDVREDGRREVLAVEVAHGGRRRAGRRFWRV